MCRKYVRNVDNDSLTGACRALVLLPCLLLMSCATIVSGRDQGITIDSVPAASNVSVTCANGTAHQGLTPFTVMLRRKAGPCNVTVERDGYSTQSIALEQGINRNYWLNLATIPLAMCAIVGWNGVLFSQPDAQSRRVGTVCLAAGIAAWVTDYRTGAVWSYEPKRVNVILKQR